jgi:thiamine pyrophosphate-dependent acetolactate synthase large subunit-like protein
VTPQKSRSGGQILVDQLLVHGVDHIFCVPGESYLAALDALTTPRSRSRSAARRVAPP